MEMDIVTLCGVVTFWLVVFSGRRLRVVAAVARFFMVIAGVRWGHSFANTCFNQAGGAVMCRRVLVVQVLLCAAGRVCEEFTAQTVVHVVSGCCGCVLIFALVMPPCACDGTGL